MPASYPAETAEACYSRYRNGDESAFGVVIEQYRENLIFFLLRYLPSPEDAEDAAEDAFVDLLLHPWREERGASLKTYLFTLGRNRALNLLKKEKRRLAFGGNAFPQEKDAAALEDKLCADESHRALLRVLADLPADYREALYLLYFEELSLDEAAKVLKKNKKQMENLSYRGKKALKEKLEKEGFYP